MVLQSQRRGRQNRFFGGSHAAQELLDPSVSAVHPQLYRIKTQLHVLGLLSKCICAVKSSWQFIQHGAEPACALQMCRGSTQHTVYVCCLKWMVSSVHIFKASLAFVYVRKSIQDVISSVSLVFDINISIGLKKSSHLLGSGTKHCIRISTP